MFNLTSKDLRQARIGYVPIDDTFNSPGDKRRFAYYAHKRNLDFEIADPTKSYDLVVLTQNADLSVWSKYHCHDAVIVYDLIDSYLAIPGYNFKALSRGFAKFISGQSKYLKLNHWNAIVDMCTRADAVVCSTDEQRSDISKYCSNVHIILDVHSGVVRTIKSDYSSNPPFRLVWEGLPQNIVSLKLLANVLYQLRKLYPIEVHIVTDSFFYKYLGKFGKSNTLRVAKKIFPEVYFHEWKEASCAEIICACDLAVIPLNLNDPFAFGKPENKLLLLWRMGMPVITSASPAYLRAMSLAGMNYAAVDQRDWFHLLVKLIQDIVAREKAGQMGKSYVDTNFSESNLLSQWDDLFATLQFHISKPFSLP